MGKYGGSRGSDGLVTSDEIKALKEQRKAKITPGNAEIKSVRKIENGLKTMNPDLIEKYVEELDNLFDEFKKE